MFTKTGLRPREIRSRTISSKAKGTDGGGSRLDNREPRSEFGSSSGTNRRPEATANAEKGCIRRGSAKRFVEARVETSRSSRGRTRFGGRSSAGGERRSRSVGRRCEHASTALARHAIRKRPEWDDSIRDPSQYRLTPEEAMRRKISLVSKHNTLVFGLNRRTTPTGAETNPSTAKASEGWARSRSAKRRVGHHQEQPRKTSAGSAVAPSKKSISSTYSGDDGKDRTGSEVTVEPAPSIDHNLTATFCNPRSDAPDPCEINDATISIFAKCNSGDANTHQHPNDAGSGSGSGGSIGGDEAGSDDEVTLKPSRNRGSGGSGGETSGSSALAGIELGIEAFSERVGRLEAYRKSDLAEEVGGSEGRRGASGKENENRDEADGSRSQHDDHSLCVWDDSRSHVHVRAEDTSSEVALEGHQHRNHQSNRRHRANPWDFDAPSPPSAFRRQQTPWHAAAHLVSMSDRFGKNEVGLVERMKHLEAQVSQLGSVHPPTDATIAATAVGTENLRGNHAEFFRQAGDGVAAGMDREERTAVQRVNIGGQPGPAVKEQQMRAVIVELLSLSSVLLERAAAAERLLRDYVDAGVPGTRGSSNAVDGTGDTDERVRRVRTWAEAVIALSGDANGVESSSSKGTNQHVVKIAGSAAANPGEATAAAHAALGAPSLSSEEAAAPSARYSRVVTPPPRPSREMTTSCTGTGDCWGEALSEVGRLVDRSNSGFCGDEENDAVAIFTRAAGEVSPKTCSPPPPPPPRALSSLGLSPLPTSVAAAMRGGTTFCDGTPTLTSSLERQLPLQPLISQNVARGPASVRPRGASSQDRDVTTLAAKGGCVPTAPVNLSRSSHAASKAEQEEEEDSLVCPLSLAPKPSNRPQHPFGNRTRPGMRQSPQVGNVVGEELISEPGPCDGGLPVFAPAGNEDPRGKVFRGEEPDEVAPGSAEPRKKEPVPPVGEWYTPVAFPRVRE